MKANIKLDTLIDLIHEADDENNSYHRLSAQHRRKYGYGVNIDRARTDEERRIAYYYHSSADTGNTVYGIISVLGLDRDQVGRLYTAARAMKRWYEDTEWQRLPSEKLMDRLGKYVMG